jgi:flagellum-specific peptidoglycan hydrolase FlgJ
MKLKEREIKDQFVLELSNRYEALQSEKYLDQEVDEVWNQIKVMYADTCESVLGKVNHNRKEWMSERSWKLVEERRELKSQLDSAKTRNQKLMARQKYNTKNHEVKRSCRKDKRDRIDSIAQEAERAAETNDIKKVYDSMTPRSCCAGRRPYRVNQLRIRVAKS